MASMRDVARKAGVGVGTVSRTLNNSGYVAEETKKKIYESMEELNYKPAPAVKTQAGRKTGFVGVMVPSLEHPFFCQDNALYRIRAVPAQLQMYRLQYHRHCKPTG